jgi:hypothetical protein
VLDLLLLPHGPCSAEVKTKIHLDRGEFTHQEEEVDRLTDEAGCVCVARG